MSYAIEIITVESRPLAVTRFHVSTSELGAMGEKMSTAFGAVMAHLGRAGIAPEAPAVARYERSGGGFDVSAGFPVAEPFESAGEVSCLVQDAGEVAHTTHLGSYEELTSAYDALRAGVEAQGRALAEDAPMWEEYWSGPDTPAEETRTDVFWPLVTG
ncbi:MAG: GyrI-like domain-containing protein [Acidimicrobiia bacterium]